MWNLDKILKEYVREGPLSARFSWKQAVGVVFIFSSKTSVLVWCGLKQAETEPKTSYVSDPRVSLDENIRFQKWAFSAGFQAENDPFINSDTGEWRADKIFYLHFYANMHA